MKSEDGHRRAWIEKKFNFDVEWKMMMKKGQKGREKDVEGKKGGR